MIARCGEGGGVSGGRHVTERGMGPSLVVGGDPSGDHGAGVIEVVEDGLVQQLVAHVAVERHAYLSSLQGFGPAASEQDAKASREGEAA